MFLPDTIENEQEGCNNAEHHRNVTASTYHVISRNVNSSQRGRIHVLVTNLGI